MKLSELEKIVSEAKVIDVKKQPVMTVVLEKQLGMNIDVETTSEDEARKVALQHILDMPANIRPFDLEDVKELTDKNDKQ